MSKKLNIAGITSELEGSAFFPSRKKPAVSPIPPSVIGEPKLLAVNKPESQPKPSLSERANARKLVRPNGKRIITRNAHSTGQNFSI